MQTVKDDKFTYFLKDGDLWYYPTSLGFNYAKKWETDNKLKQHWMDKLQNPNQDKLKEHIKILAREAMNDMVSPEDNVNEDNTCGSAGEYSTPKAFKGEEVDEVTGSPKKMGRRYIPDETILPGSLKKAGFRIMSNGETVNLFISPLAIAALGALQRGRTNMKQDELLPRLTILFREKMPSMTRVVIKKGLQGVKINNQPWIPVNVEVTGIDPDNGDIIIKVPKPGQEKSPAITNPLYEQISEMIDEKLLLEGNYNQFRNEIKFRTKSEQLHKAIREVKKKLGEIDRIVEYTSRMKQELSEGEDGVKYWKATEKAVGKIQEAITHLSNKIRNLNQ
jgi:hypothetical protein